MRVPRMTVRRWMVAIAVIGTMFEVDRVWKRSRVCFAMAGFHAAEGQDELLDANLPPKYYVCGTYWISLTPEEKRRERESRPSAAAVRTACLRNADYHFRLKAKSVSAAWRPWEGLPDDPPDPPEE
jgi:hypothetical protein